MKKLSLNTPIPNHVHTTYHDKYIVLLDDVYPQKHTKEAIKNESFVVVLIDEGWASTKINDTQIKLEKGDMLLCAPGTVLQREDTSKDFRCCVFAISSEHANDILRGTRMSMSYYLMNSFFEIFRLTTEERNMLREFYHLISSFSPMPQDEIREECISKILQSFSYAFAGLFQHRGFDLKKDKGTSAETLFRKFLQSLEDNPHGRTVQYYANELNITPKYLNTISKLIAGKTASKLISEKIVNEALSLLNDSELSIKQISATLGFVNQSHFGSFMRRETGTSPQNLRKNKQ